MPGRQRFFAFFYLFFFFLFKILFSGLLLALPWASATSQVGQVEDGCGLCWASRELKAIPGPRWGAHLGSSSDMAAPFTGVWQQLVWEQIEGFGPENKLLYLPKPPEYLLLCYSSACLKMLIMSNLLYHFLTFPSASIFLLLRHSKLFCLILPCLPSPCLSCPLFQLFFFLLSSFFLTLSKSYIYGTSAYPRK